MKVNVRFGSVSVVVPCGYGDLSVRQLIIEAIIRYKKATAKPPDSWVLVHSLQGAGGGILDPDDRLSDVVDDREQIIACYEEEGGPGHHHNIGDGTSASSSSPSSTASPTHSPAFQNHKSGLVNGHSSKLMSRSPEIFQGMDHQFHPFSRNGIEITGEELQRRGNTSGLTVVDPSMGSTLQVRRGSEPSLNCIGGPGDLSSNQASDRVTVNGAGSGPGPPGIHIENKRWSAAPIIDDDDDDDRLLKVAEEGSRDDGASSSGGGSSGVGGSSNKSPFSRGIGGGDLNRRSRDATRLSMQVGSFAGDLILSRWLDKDSGIDGPRREPLGSSLSPDHSDSERDREEVTMVIRPEGEPLGLHVVPDYDPNSGAERGLRVQRLEPESRAHRDGQLHVNDRIVEINGQHLIGMPFTSAHELFREAMESPDILLRVVKAGGRHFEEFREKDAPVWNKEEPRDDSKPASSVAATPAGKKNAVLPNRASTVIMSANTRKIGKILTIDLVKGPQGLGFSLTTRDNPAGGSAPIYVKNILPKGAAIEDGRLKPGDRLLEINGADMNGKSQGDVVNVLRNIATGTKVTLTVSRQEIKEEKPLSPKLPRELPSDKAEEDAAAKQREIMTLYIPVHDSERAGLGVSVKGKTSNSNDLGIFVKSVIHGGAASKDGRLTPNDQLLSINGISLLNMSNSDAMETLRKAMCQEGPVPGKLTLTIARKLPGDDSRSSPGSQSSGSGGRNLGNASLSGSAETLDDGYGKNGPSSDSPDGAAYQHDSGRHGPPLPMKKSGIEDRDLGFDVLPMRNPVIDRITGQNSLRNDSYCKATHDASWSPGGTASSHLSYFMSGKRHDDEGSPGRLANGGVRPGGTIISQSNQETVMIEDEYVPPLPHRDNSSTLASDSRRTSNNSDVAYASQTSLEETPVGFSRDQFGRQSMSEKGHATLDAKNTDTYQRNKRIREERHRMQQLQAAEAKKGKKSGKDIGPGLGMKKSSSLESLQTMVQELSQAEDGDPALSYRPNPVRVVRGRGCNESFRAAVDRSYEAPLQEHGRPVDVPQSVSEEDPSNEMPMNGPRPTGPKDHQPPPHEQPPPLNPRAHPPQSSSRQQQQREVNGPMARGSNLQSSMPERSQPTPPTVVHVRSQSSTHPQPHKTAPDQIQPQRRQADSSPSPAPSPVSPVKAPKDKKKGSFFKGLGTMFRFGKHRDMREVEATPVKDDKSRPASSTLGKPGSALAQKQREERRAFAREEEARMRMERQRNEMLNQQNMQNGVPPPPQRTPRMDPGRGQFEGHRVKGGNGDYLTSYSGNYEEMTRPGCRSGFADPSRYSHYENYSEIQQHLSGVKRTNSPMGSTGADYLPMNESTTSAGPSIANTTRKSNSVRLSKKKKAQQPRPKSSQFYIELADWHSVLASEGILEETVFDSTLMVSSTGDDAPSPNNNSCKYEFNRTRSCNATVLSGAGACGPRRFPSPVVVDCLNNNPREIRRRQQQVYHSQRRGRNGGDNSRERPKSNFYEYESVAALVRPATALGAPSGAVQFQQQQMQENSSQPSSVRSRHGPAIHNSLPKKSQNRHQHPSIESAFPQQKVPHQGPYRNNGMTNGPPQGQMSHEYAGQQPQQPPPPPHATRMGPGVVPPPYQHHQPPQQHIYQQHPQPLQSHKHPAQRSMMQQQMQLQNIPGHQMQSSSLHRVPQSRPGLPPPEYFDQRRRNGPAPGHGSRVHPGYDGHQPPATTAFTNGPGGQTSHHMHNVQYNGSGMKPHAPPPPPHHYQQHHYPGASMHPRQQATQS